MRSCKRGKAMLQNFLISLRSGLRSQGFIAIFILGILAMGGAYLAAQFSARQPATVAMDTGLSFIRIVGLLLALFWGYEFLGKEIERRTLFVSLTYPVPRSSFLIGRFTGIAVLLLLALLVLGLMLDGTVLLAGKSYLQATPISLGGPFWLTLIYVWLDLLVVASFGFLVTVFSTSVFLPLGVGLAFAVSARSLGPALDYLIGDQGNGGEAQLLPILNVLRWLMPDLSKLDIRYFALYGHQPNEQLLISGAIMAIAYMAILLFLAAVFFRNREFN